MILGRSDGEEKVLAYQVGGVDSAGTPMLGAGEWREGSGHRRSQTCVREVDLDINIHVRKRR